MRRGRDRSRSAVTARLTRLLDPYVAAQDLGLVFHPHAVMRFEGSEVEPDLMVRAEKEPGREDWTEAPTPLLIVEIHAPSTRRRDYNQKRGLYMDAGVGEYWMIDPDARTITAVRAGMPDVVARDTLVWNPPGTSASLTIDLASVFG